MGSDWLIRQIVLACGFRREFGYHWRIEQFFPSEWSV